MTASHLSTNIFQVEAARILARLYIEREQTAAASAVFEALAGRQSGLGELAVALADRADLYQSAILQARSLSLKRGCHTDAGLSCMLAKVSTQWHRGFLLASVRCFASAQMGSVAFAAQIGCTLATHNRQRYITGKELWGR